MVLKVSLGSWFHLEMFWRCLGLFHTPVDGRWRCVWGIVSTWRCSGDVWACFTPQWMVLKVSLGSRFHLVMLWRCLGLFHTSVGGPEGEFGVLVASGDVLEMFGPVLHLSEWFLEVHVGSRFHLEMFWRCLGLFHTPMGCSEGEFGVLVPPGDVLEMFGPVLHLSEWFLEVHVGSWFHLELLGRLPCLSPRHP